MSWLHSQQSNFVFTVPILMDGTVYALYLIIIRLHAWIWLADEHSKVYNQGCRALIVFEGAREGGGGGVLSCGFLFIKNIPKRITKYLDCHLDYDGQSSLQCSIITIHKNCFLRNSLFNKVTDRVSCHQFFFNTTDFKFNVNTKTICWASYHNNLIEQKEIKEHLYNQRRFSLTV